MKRSDREKYLEQTGDNNSLTWVWGLCSTLLKSQWQSEFPLTVVILNWHSVYFSHSVLSDSLRPHEPQHARPPCQSPTPGVHPNPCPSSRRCHPIISSSVVPFSCPQSFQGTSVFKFHGCSHHPQWFSEPKKIKFITVSIVCPSIRHELV